MVGLRLPHTNVVNRSLGNGYKPISVHTVCDSGFFPVYSDFCPVDRLISEQGWGEGCYILGKWSEVSSSNQSANIPIHPCYSHLRAQIAAVWQTGRQFS